MAVASSAGSVLPSFTSISFMDALEAVAGAAPAVSAFAPWAAWVESSAGFGVSSVFMWFSPSVFDGCASGGGVCLRTAFHFRLGGDLAACAVGTAVLPTCGWVVTSPLVVAGLAPLFIPLAEQLALSRRSSRYCHALALASSPGCRGTGRSGFSAVTTSKDPSAKTRMNAAGCRLGGISSSEFWLSGGSAVSAGAGEVGLSSSCGPCGDGDAITV